MNYRDPKFEWTERHDRQLIALRSDGMEIKDIAAAIGTSTARVERRLSEMAERGLIAIRKSPRARESRRGM